MFLPFMTYQRLSSKENGKIRRLISEGKSLSSISKVLAKPKTTIYHHFLKLKGKTTFPTTIISNNQELIEEFIGSFAGDGYACKFNDYKYRTYIAFNSIDENYVHDFIENVLTKIFSKKPMLFRRKSCILLCYYSKNIHSLLYKYLVWDIGSKKTYSVALRGRDYTGSFLTGFLRGSVDSDGHISDKKISFATVSPGLKESITYALEKLHIKHSVHLYKEKRLNRKDIYHIFVSREDHQKFLQCIKPRNKKGVRRPGRSVSLLSQPRIRNSECLVLPNISRIKG